MGNWNLSVDIRGTGHSLARELRQSATHARTLGTAARTARTNVRELGQASQTAARHVRSLGTAARTTGRDLTRLGSGAGSAARQLHRYGDAARNANRHVNSLGDHSRTAGRDLARMSGQIDGAIRDLLRLAQAAQRASTHMNGLGNHGAASMRRYADETGRLRHQLVGAAALLSGGGLVMGVGELIKNGNEYQQAMNTFGAVTGATAVQMQRAAGTANQLGNDLSIPGASAIGAAESMVELAKAGFRTDQAISASRSSLILASAAQVSAADSAKYLGDMMDQFGLGADQASVAADTLAATANAASGDIIDIYYAMKYAGPVAHGLGVTMQEAATGVGMLGKAGILGQTAGTTMRGIFTNLSKPTKQMTQGLTAMGIEAYDAQGKFKGLRYVVEKLQLAEHSMSQKDFTANVAKAFGKPAMSGAIALAHQGTASYDALIKAVSETGAASDIAAAKGKGLSGAMLQLKTQAKQTGLTIYNGMAPGLEFLTRGITTGLSKATPKIEAFFRYFNDAATLFGPGIAAAARKEFGSIGDAASGMMKPFKEFGADALASGLHVILNVGKMVVEVLKNLADGVRPVVSALGDIAGEGSGAATALDTVVFALDAGASAVGFLSGVLGPLGHMVGGLVSMFGALPGPIQTAVFAMLLMRRVGPMAQSLAGTVSGRLTGAFASFNQQMAVQRSLAAASGASLGRYGAAFAVLQARVPVLGRMGESFRTATAASSGFAGTLRGIGAASATAARALGTGLMGALGGPWGLAITAATVGLSMLASHQQKAAAAAAEHEARIRDLAQALRESNGAIDANVRTTAAQGLQDMKLADGKTHLVDVTKKAGIGLRQLTDAYLGQGDSLGTLRSRLEAIAEQHTRVIATGRVSQKVYDEQGTAAKSAADAIGSMGGDMDKAVGKAKDLANATKDTGDGASAYTRLKDAVGALADKTADADTRTRALRDALDLLSGGSVSLQAAQARVNEAVTNANEAMAAGINQADGWGKALINANGTLNTTTKNGQSLFNTLNTITDSSASAAIAAYDFARSQGKDVAPSIAAARQEMQSARDDALKLAAGYGLLPAEANKVADSMGLIPGQVSILLQTKGVDTALAELLAVQAEFARMPKAKTIKVDALGAEAKKELEDIGYQIELIPGTREYKITAPTAGARAELDLLIAKLGSTNGKTIKVDAATDAAISDLETLKTKVAGTKGKTVTMSVPTAEGRKQLELLGYKIQSTKGKTVTILVPTGDAASRIASLQRQIDSLSGRTINITTHYQTTGSPYAPSGGRAARDVNANGSITNYYADGGVNADKRNQHVAHIAKAGTWRVFAEDETGGESYIPLAASKRPRSRAIAEETVRRLGGDPNAIQWNAEGNVTDWRYDPQSGSLYSPSDAGSAAHKTKKVKGKEINYFDLGALEKKLRATSDMTRRWNADLGKVADRVGGDVAEALAAMGTDGYELTKKMATGSTKYINQMAAALRGLAATAKASLTDYTRQLSKATTMDAAFAKNLATLAGRGYGDLAKQLAAQGDTAAQQLAASAVGNSKQAASANTAAKNSNNALTSDQVQQLVAIIAAVKSSKTGIHDVADATGLGEDDIVAVASKASGQIKSALGDRSAKFLADLARASKGLSYADGGIRTGIYSTRGGAVTFAEPSTGGEAYIPLGSNKRRDATKVLNDVARRFGVGLTDLASRQIVVVRDAGDTHVNVTAVRTGASASDIGYQVGRSVRRAHRGGVAARA